ncbi:MAG: hypothetical protein AAF849_17495 [Bacteroidota bacterium]
MDAKKSGKKDAAYLQLFNTINKMETYDESILKAKFKHLSVDKAYLYNAILRSMRDYHSKKSRAAQIKEHLMDAKYLYERELYDLCEAALQEAKQLAEELGDHLSLLEINKQMRKVVKTTKKGIGEGALVSLQEVAKKSSLGVHEEFLALDADDLIFSKTVSRKELTNQEIEQFQKYLRELKIRHEKGFSSIHAEHRYHRASGFFNLLVQNIDEYFKAYSNVMKWWDKNPEFKEEAFYNYIIDVSNFLAACFRRERFDNFAMLIERLEQEHPTNIHHQKILFQRLFQFKLVHNINFGKIDNILIDAEEVHNGLLKFSINQSTQKVLILNIAILFLVSEKYDKCLNWCDLLLKKSKTNVRKDIDRGIYYIKLICSYELDEFELFENICRSTNRFLIKDNHSLMQYFLDFLQMIKKLVDTPLYTLKEEMINLKKYIEKMRFEIAGRIPLVGVDEMTICWIDSKLQKKSIAEIVRAGRKN